jgi:orotate phosphoribosyltransferase
MVDRDQGGREALAAQGCRLEAVFTAKELLAAVK